MSRNKSISEAIPINQILQNLENQCTDECSDMLQIQQNWKRMINETT